ncbi:ABC transporter substrate-binding protein [Actinosynnema sp. NPDC047251]|uniref:ABC-type dipeptide transporter, permease subunit n=1 Tax=Saccharothrix espanaensis (strain ATCC 51144 / DSM 44229 / JCM 9112 / NBRC 15066 / NRRL 15764) TaxID=1179773 RepID=K0K0Z2_SACES|nr:ABC transporter substrate-binding protein [Saccharothrix espanaensis]CCH32011.1 ABC-type dipeptide transporter, permease subunit [Saccharothrix espanaensis DSM 44229]
MPRRRATVESPSRRVAALVCGLVLALAACGGGAGAGPGPAANPVPGGELTFAVDSEPVSFDVHVSPQDITGEILRNVFDSLVSVDAEGRFTPWLATSWEIAPDLRSYTFHLRDGVEFTDGTPFDAAAVKANFDRIADPATKSQLAASLLGPYAGTEVVDPRTVKVTFTAPFAPFLQGASTTYLGFYSPKALADNADKLAGGGPVAVGTGPFTFTAYTKGQSIVLGKNPDYNWGPEGSAHTGAAYLDKLTVRFLAEDSVRVGALTSGQIHVARAIAPVDIRTLEANPDVTLLKSDIPGGNYNLYLNASKAPFDDPLVRKAVQRAIDVDQGVKTVYFGQYKRAWSPLSPSTTGYDAKLDNSVRFDQAEAGKLLDQAGWTTRDSDGYRTRNGARLVVKWPLMPPPYLREQRDVLGQAFQADLKKVGVEVVRDQPDIGTFIKQVYGGEGDFTDYSWNRFEPDVLWLFFNSASQPGKGGQNATFTKDDELDRLTEAGRATADPAARAESYAKVQQRSVVDLALVLPVYTPVNSAGVGKSVRGLAYTRDARLGFYDVWLDQR